MANAPLSGGEADIFGNKLKVTVEAFLRKVILHDGFYIALVEIPFTAGDGYQVTPVPLRCVKTATGARLTAD
jgi:hypothetical protein